MSKATHQSTERHEDKRSSLMAAARRPAAQLQIPVCGLPTHFARLGRDGPPTLILYGLVYVGKSASNRRPLSSLQKILALRRKNIGRSQTAPRSSRHEANFRPQPAFLPTANVWSVLSVGPLKSGAAIPAPPAIQNFFTEERRNMRPFAVSSRTILP